MIVFDNPVHAVLLSAHIAAGVVGLAAGFAAFALRKGGNLHRVAGKVFVPAMVVMLALGGVVSAMDPARTDWVGIPFLVYLTLTAWMAARARDGLGRHGRWLVLFGAAAVAMMFVFVAIGVLGGKPSAGGPQAVAPFVLAGVAALTIGLDLRVLARGGVSGPARVRRHVWRVSVAMFTATGSFFLGQMDEFPRAIQGPVWFVPALAPLVLMIFWMWRWRDRRARRLPPAAAEAAA